MPDKSRRKFISLNVTWNLLRVLLSVGLFFALLAFVEGFYIYKDIVYENMFHRDIPESEALLIHHERTDSRTFILTDRAEVESFRKLLTDNEMAMDTDAILNSSIDELQRSVPIMFLHNATSATTKNYSPVMYNLRYNNDAIEAFIENARTSPTHFLYEIVIRSQCEPEPLYQEIKARNMYLLFIKGTAMRLPKYWIEGIADWEQNVKIKEEFFSRYGDSMVLEPRDLYDISEKFHMKYGTVLGNTSFLPEGVTVKHEEGKPEYPALLASPLELDNAALRQLLRHHCLISARLW